MTVAWITGGGTGIGRALAERLYGEGAQVIITGRRRELLEAAAQAIAARPSSGQLLAIAGDAADPAHVRDVAAQAAARWGMIDLLINNAGVNLHSEVSEAPVEEYQKSFETNCLTALRATQAVLPAMLEANRGAIVNISSIYGKWASSRSAAYSVTKHALTGYTDALRQSLRATRIQVLGVFPGFIKTDMTLPFVDPGSWKNHFGKSPDQLAAAVLAALRRGNAELYYPWYVPWVLRLARWAPRSADALSDRAKR